MQEGDLSIENQTYTINIQILVHVVNGEAFFLIFSEKNILYTKIAKCRCKGFIVVQNIPSPLCKVCKG